MFKKTMLLAMAVGAFAALAAPTVASAQQLTDNGKALKAGALFTATSTNLKTTTPLGELTCANVTIHLKVTANGVGTSAATSESVTTSGCHLKTGNGVLDPVTITKGTADFHIEKKGVGSTTATFIADIYKTVLDHEAGLLSAECHFSGTPGITYTAGTDVVRVEGALLGEEPCSKTGNTIHGDFTLETPNAPTFTPIIID